MSTPIGERDIPNGDQIHRSEPAEKRPDVAALKELAKNGGGLAILIAGLPGTGTSTLDRNLRSAFGLPHETPQTTGAGDAFRQQSTTPVIGFIPRSITVDRKLDKRTARRIKRTNRTVKLVEGRLAAWVGAENSKKAQATNKPYPNVLTVLVHADETDRVQRAWERDVANYPTLTIEDARAGLLSREVGDLRQFQRAHPKLQGINPLDPNDPWSQTNYDVMLNSSKLSPEDGVQRVIEAAVSKFLGPGNQAAELGPQTPAAPQGADDDDARLESLRIEIKGLQWGTPRQIPDGTEDPNQNQLSS